jgi:hypothetical protein
MPQLAAGALIFLRGDVHAARSTVDRSYSREQVYDSVRLPSSERPYFTPGFPLAVPLLHGSRIRSLDARQTTAATFDPVEADPFVSDTGELAWSVASDRTGQVTVETERTQAFIGHTATGRRRLKNLGIAIDNAFCSIVLSTLDARPITRSARMLLTTGGRVVNTDMQWNESHTALTNWGRGPSLIEPIAGRVLLAGLEDVVDVRATALDGAGRALGAPIHAVQTQEGWTITLGTTPTTWYEVAVTRTKTSTP